MQHIITPTIHSLRTEAVFHSYLGPGTLQVHEMYLSKEYFEWREKQISPPVTSRVSGSAFMHLHSHNSELPITGLFQERTSGTRQEWSRNNSTNGLDDLSYPL